MKKIRGIQNKNAEAFFLSPKHDLRSPALAKKRIYLSWLIYTFLPMTKDFREAFLGLQLNQHKDFQQIHLGE